MKKEGLKSENMKSCKSKQISILLIAGFISIVGCSSASQLEARKQASQDILESLRANVDLNGRENPNVTPDEEAPEISGLDSNDEKFSLNDYRGKVVLLSFLGNW